MKTHEHSQTDVTKQVDCLVKQHLVEAAEATDDGKPVAAVSASDRFSWAKQAGVDIEFIDRRMAAICEQVTASDQHWAVPRYRMKN